jgi:hypothetical protein
MSFLTSRPLGSIKTPILLLPGKCCAGYLGFSIPQLFSDKERITVQKFEYKVEKIDARGFWSSKIEPAEMQDLLNNQGQEGWDLITAFDTSKHEGSTSGAFLIFKRPQG